ncbi:MAG: FG-GAP repeat protein [Isosphaeraceae bacterium]|nr:FG-GAP repeat protein [Isosphaeraceae bacterium]
MTRSKKQYFSSSRPHTGRRLARPAVELLEHRLCLSTVKASAVVSTSGSGVDSLALGDVNVDRFADVAVATHQDGHYIVTIYSGAGQTGDTQTGYEALPLVTLTDPLGPGVGPLSVALGDFNGNGSSDLAISSTASQNGASPSIKFFSFQLTQNSPYNSPVTAVPMGSPLTVSGLGSSNGITLAAAEFSGSGPDNLVVASTGSNAKSVEILGYQPTSATWHVVKTINNVPVNTTQGLSLSAGDVTGDGTPDIVVGSNATGQVAVFDPPAGRWVWATSPLGDTAQGIRVAVVSNENAPGSIVVTGTASNGKQEAAIVPWQRTSAVRFLPLDSPGTGTLVPLGGGYVYQRSTVQNPTATFPTSTGPVTPTVIFGATGAIDFVVQGFTSKGLPNKEDTYFEPLTGSSTTGFWPLQSRKDAATGGNAPQPTDLPADTQVPTNLVAYPKIDYTSPFSINLSAAPPSIYNGLFPNTPIVASGDGPWGPAKVPNTPPTIPAGQGTNWLRERVIAAAASYIGVDYQHHYNARWSPKQGSTWNLTTTVAYQSQGIDCTNFTALVYADALGITINSDTTQQALISQTNLNGTIIPTSLNNPSLINVQAIDHTQWTSYQSFLNIVQPGDILIINGNPSNPSQATHAIIWLGQYGKDKNNVDNNLVIDSTGTNPWHINSNDQVVPEGVQIRPFGAPNSSNAWYFNHVDHILRIIAN